MSEKHRKELAEVAANLGLDVLRLPEMSEQERWYFWREFYELRELLATIDREFPLYTDAGQEIGS